MPRCSLVAMVTGSAAGRTRPSHAVLLFLRRKSIKKLVLKNLSSSQYSSSSLNKDSDDLASPSEYPQNGHRYRSDPQVPVQQQDRPNPTQTD